MVREHVLLLSALFACTPSPVALSPLGVDGRAPVSSEVPPETPPEAPPEPPEVEVAPPELLVEGLFPDGIAAACEPFTTRCAIEATYKDDNASLQLALALYDEFGDVAGVEEAYTMQGGFRGEIQIVPELPVGGERHHLEWVLGAQRDLADFLGKIEEQAAGELSYRHAPITWRFFRSVGRTTPSAYASGSKIAYNLSGSLNRSAGRVRELVFHEAFHLNDGDRDGWSQRVLGEAVEGVVARCGTDVDCLAPYAPGTTKVVGGTYYAFQQDNGIVANEYAAELAVRYLREQQAALAGRPPRHAFKCGPAPNAENWSAFVEEFFAGVDLIPACPDG